MTTLDITTLDADVAALKARIEVATRNRIRAEQQRDNAAAVAESHRAVLREHFGVDTLTEAQEMLDTLNKDLTTATDTLKTLLDTINDDQ